MGDGGVGLILNNFINQTQVTKHMASHCVGGRGGGVIILPIPQLGLATRTARWPRELTGGV